MNRLNVEPATLHRNIVFNAPEREGESISVLVEASRIDHDTYEMTAFNTQLVWPCAIVRSSGPDELIRYSEDCLRKCDHFIGPISQQIFLAELRAFLRSTDMKSLAGDRPFLEDMPVMGRC